MEGEDSGNGLYKECLRNHAASLGSYATDGCGEFTLDDESGALNCAACGCHRNFHRKVTEGRPYEVGVRPEMVERQLPAGVAYSPDHSTGKKRFRTKFTEEQKEKMLVFAEKLGWKMLRKDADDEIERFCRRVGISRKVFKVWMHNHKNNSNSVAFNGNTSSLTED